LDSFIEDVGFDEYLFIAIVGSFMHSECPISVDTESIEMGTAECCHILDNYPNPLELVSINSW
jgi:hypothetical protein